MKLDVIGVTFPLAKTGYLLLVTSCHLLGTPLPPTEESLVTHQANLERYKSAARKEISLVFKDRAAKALESLSVQGDLLRLLEEQKGDLHWISMIRQAPRGLLQFATRAITDTLASPSNLARWNKVVDSSCKLCSRKPATLFHLLSGCKISLEQKRYNTRHNLVLEYLAKTFKDNAPPMCEVYADIDSYRVQGGTIPPQYSTQAQTPDLVLVDRTGEKDRITVVELTIPWDSEESFTAAEDRKTAKYAGLIRELNVESRTELITLEIGTRGLISTRNK